MYAVILAGGSGTRLWPLSRVQFPKQFISLNGNGNSLFQGTVNRVKAIVPEENIIIVAHQKLKDNIQRELAEMGLRNATLLKEPQSNNTAPAIGMAAWYLRAMKSKDEKAIMLVLPSDHLIRPQEGFVEVVDRAREAAIAYGLVTFGIKPTYPETGYGYIRCGEQLNKWIYRVDEFVEKPKLDLAKKYLADSHYLWNSGMFVFELRELIAQYHRYLPSLAAGLDEINYQSFANIGKVYDALESVSIDYGILERSKDVTVIPTDITWSDVGSWDAIYKVFPKDAAGNCLHGRVVSLDTHNSLAYSPERLVGLVGVDNLAVVATEDAVLVCSRGKSQQVRALVAQLEAEGATECIVHPTVHRPWGSYTVLEDKESYQVKRITVNPGCRLSLQSHRHRSEHWVVAKGKALATVNDKERLLAEGGYVFIPLGARHRLENPGQELLEIIEVQKGVYLGEDDIIRYEDDYGRTKPFVTPNQIYQQWLQADSISDTDMQELRGLAGNGQAIQERFGAELSFGTGGLRGKIGVGLNRMNVYVVRRTTQGLANYLKRVNAKCRAYAETLKVAIAYDTRHYSKEFAQAAAQVLAANGIKALIFAKPRPTPQLSFAVRELSCAAGIVITASHNPPQYNGYKVYEPSGGQAVSPFVDELAKAIEVVDIFKDIKSISRQNAENQGLLETINSQLDELYLARVASLSLSKPRQKVKLVFTSLHGTGSMLIPQLLEQTGYIDLFTVDAQMISDPNFSTVKSPNPEDKQCFKMSLALAEQKDADLIMATDPDCDRLGCAVKNDKGTYELLTGDQIGALLVGYILGRLKEKGQLSPDGVIIKTIVTDDLGMKVAASYGIKTIETLTGFKYIGEKVEQLEAAKSDKFLFGYEESYGYLAGDFVRDKDANIASLLIAEMAAFHKERGQDLLRVLDDLQCQFGFHKSDLISLELRDKRKADRLMEAFNHYPPSFKGMQVVEKRDYYGGLSLDIATGKTSKLTLPQAKVLYYRYDDGSWFCVRPSGTEPKLKLYLSVVANSSGEAKTKSGGIKTSVQQVINNYSA